MANIAVDKSLLKEYATDGVRTVYMKDGDEFQIQLVNLYSRRVSVEVELNGETIDGRLVLRPGERCWLERYLGLPRKFRFGTYMVDGSDKDVAEAISSNGMVRLRFYEETPPCPKFGSFTATAMMATGDGIRWTLAYPWHEDRVHADGPSYDTYGGDNVMLCSAGDIPHDMTSCTFGDGMTATSCDMTFGLEYDKACEVETGRVSYGSDSTQEFDVTDGEWRSVPSREEAIRILPISAKPYSASDAQKVYCTECGRRLNPKYKFCPFCGSKVE